MNIHTSSDCDKALVLFPADGVARDQFVQLVVNLHLKNHTDGKEPPALRPVQRVSGSFSSLLTIADRHNWQKAQFLAGRIDGMAWMFHAACDVEYYYVVLRSLFDDLALLFSSLATKRGVVPQSFNDLVKWGAEPGAEGRLGKDLAEVLAGFDWFSQIRDTRNGLVHFGALTLAIPQPEGVTFRVARPREPFEMRPALMSNEHMADFEMFIAWTVGNIALAMDRLGTIALSQLGTPAAGGASTALGRLVVREYLLKLRSRLASLESQTGANDA